MRGTPGGRHFSAGSSFTCRASRSFTFALNSGLYVGLAVPRGGGALAAAFPRAPPPAGAHPNTHVVPPSFGAKPNADRPLSQVPLRSGWPSGSVGVGTAAGSAVSAARGVALVGVWVETGAALSQTTPTRAVASTR